MCLVEHAEIARAVIREAYRAGAQHVVVLYSDLHLRRAAIELGPESEIGWSAPYLLDWIKRWPEENPALISLAGNPDPDLLSDLDPSLVGRADPKDIRGAMLENITGRHVNWTIVGGAERRLGNAGLRGAGRRASVGSRRHGHAGSTSRIRWRRGGRMRRRSRHAPTRSTPRVRRDPVSRPGNRPHGGPHPGSELALRDVRDGQGNRAHPEHADGRGLHDARLASCGGERALDDGRSSPEGRRCPGSRFVSKAAGSSRSEPRRSRDRSAQLAADEQAAFLGEVALVDGSSPSSRPVSCSATRSTTRTPRATSRTAPASRACSEPQRRPTISSREA